MGPSPFGIVELADIKPKGCLSYLSCLSCLASLSPCSREKPTKNSPSIGTPAKFMFKNHGPSSCTTVHLTKWTAVTKSNLEHQWPLYGTSPQLLCDVMTP